MRAICLSLAIFTFALIFSSCANDSPVTTKTSDDVSGTWTVDKVQLVSAPTNGTASAMMKQALVPLGELSASSAGYLDITFGGETMTTINNDLNLVYRVDMAFYGSSGFAYDYAHYKVSSTINGGISWNNYRLPSSAGPNMTPLAPASATTLYYVAKNFGTTEKFYLYKSTNRGFDWQPAGDKLPFSIYGYSEFNTTLAFVNENTGYALGRDSLLSEKLYKTTNGGVNWAAVYNNTNGFFRLFFVNEQIGFSTKYNFPTGYSLMKTTDGGITWTSYSLPPGVNGIGEINFINPSIGFMNTDAGFYKSNNGGISWIKHYAELSYFAIKNENECYGISNYTMLKSSNGGVDWTPYAAGASSYPVLIRMVNNEPVFFSAQNTLMKPNGVTDPLKWIAKGKITSSIIKLISGAEDKETFANGTIAFGDLTPEGQNITLKSDNYSEGQNEAQGQGKYYFYEGNLYITLNLPNNEVWKIKLKRK